MHYCSFCETELSDHALFCSQCGYALNAPNTIDEVKDKKCSPSEDGVQQVDTVVVRNLLAGRYKRPSPATDGVPQEDAIVVRRQEAAPDKRPSTSGDVQPPDVSITSSRISTAYDKVLGHLPMPAKRAITEVLNRARDPKPEEVSTSQTSHPIADGSQAITWGWFPVLALASALGMVSVAYAYTTSRYGATGAEFFFWLGLLVMFVPSVVRLISPAASRFERLSLLCFVGTCFYITDVVARPFAFSGFDAFIHWRTADDIARSAHLFSVNPLLPASPFYPGLEIVTNALSTISGVSTFTAGIIIIGIARLIMILSLFILYERITKSARVAGIATILYMANPHFLFFDAEYSYESLALPLATLVLFAAARHEMLTSDRRWITLTACIPLAAVVVTHHLTSFVFDGLLLLWAVIYAFQRPGRLHRSGLATTALFGIILSLAWIGVQGNPVVDYLSSYFGGALNELGKILTGTSTARQLFVDYSGQTTPLWERLTAASSVALILSCLPFGLLCLWLRYRYNALAYMFGIASFFYPISHVFRFTNFGSEITDRAAAFLFIPLACVLAIFITQFWPTRWLSWKQTSLISCAVSLVFLGGVILGSGPPWGLLPGPYLVGADGRSVEPEGIQTALWARSYLGTDNRISTDRTNRLLMSTYGDQRVVTGLEDKVDVSPVFFSPSFGPYEVSILREAKVRYLVVDLRLSKALPSIGIYFEVGEPDSYHHTVPIDLKALTKFETIPQINRVFDSGDIVIYDVGGLINAPEKP